MSPSGKSSDPARRLQDGAFWRAYHSPIGPATLRMEPLENGVRATAWGPGAEHALETLPRLVGADDDPTAFEPDHPLLRELWRPRRGARIGRTDRAVEILLATIPGQRVTAKSAGRTKRELAFRFGDPAPGPAELRLPPDPEQLARLSYANLHNAGLERSRATTLLEVCRRRNRIEQLGQRDPEQAMAALRSIRGIGVWTANRVAEVAWGYTDAVEIGDYWLPSTVTWALAGEPRGDDARMLELLEPFRPHRARVMRLLKSGRIKPPRYGPKIEVRDFRSQ